MMNLIRHPLHPPFPGDLPRIFIEADRRDLAKRRWRGVAEDGREFGFDLEEPLRHESVFFAAGAACYAVRQRPERVLEIALGAAEAGVRLGWSIGNLHFQLQVENGVVRVADDPALRQLFIREAIPFRETDAVFQPSGGPAHSHHSH